MSANIYCRPINVSKKSIPTAAPQAFMEAIKEAFGDFPVTIGTTSDRLILRGMIASSAGDWKECFKILYREIERHGGIEIFAIY